MRYWTEWKNHDGRAVPHLSGMLVRAQLDDGSETESRVDNGRGGSWIWRDGYNRVLRYKTQWESIFDVQRLFREKPARAALSNTPEVT